MAVRLAIGESQIIQETRDFFLSHGVDIDVLESFNSANKSAKRSNTAILIKNISHELVEDELESMFARFF
jgi:multiple RNA-binding domain-containing protein 1